VLSAQSLANGTTTWTFNGDGQLDTAPILISTPAGEFVIEGSASGVLYALNAASGAVVWSANVGAAIAQPDEQNADQLTGLAAGQGLLVVPAGNTISAYAAATAPTVSSFTPQSGPPGTSVTIAGSNLTGTSAVRFNGASASYAVVSDTQITATVPVGATSGPISLTTPGGTATSSTPFTVTNPDFSITATPATQTVTAGSSTTYTITVNPSGGFTGTVTLTLNGLPAGATANFNPSSTSSSTLTVQASRNSKPGSSTLTITGTSGNLNHKTTVTLQIKKK
jgi:hypothetical protein